MAQHQPLSNKEKMNIFLPLIVGLALAGGTFLGFVMSSRNANQRVVITGGGNVGKFGEIMRFVDARYLEEEDLNKLEDAAINAALNDLDPHSRYISLSEIQDVKESLSGNFEGIGVEFYILEDTIYIVNVIKDGPSEKAGVKDGDKIITINDTLVAGKDVYNREVMNKLKGTAGSKVTIGIKRRGESNLTQIEITRGKIARPSINVAYMLDAKTGLIKINRFSGTTYDEFMGAMKKMTDGDQLENLILDLRRNPGGYLDASVRILDQLFSSKKLLVYTEGRSYKRKEHKSTGKNLFTLNKIMILIDEGSASASEIVAGAIQDNDRGLVIGRRSFGKGLVQEQYALSDGSALRLTVAKYFTPSGRCIQKPYTKDKSSYNQDLQNRFDSGELYSQDSIQVNDSVEYRTMSGRIVYGGGGITPDVFVPIDTLFLNPYYLAISSYIPNFVYHYIDVNREKLLMKYSDFKSFDANFIVGEKLMEQFIIHTEKKEIEREPLLVAKFKKRLQYVLKAYLVRQLYEEEDHYKILHREDKMVQRALLEIKR